MKDIAAKIMMFDNNIINEEDFISKDYEDSDTVYEVIRIIDGVPLFLEDHYERLTGSLKALGLKPAISLNELASRIKKLAKANSLTNCNAKLNVFVKAGKQNLLIYISKSYYPGQEEISKGVKTGLIHLERNNPNVKQINHSYKEAAENKIKEIKAFEVLLVNQEGKITEGSKSNTFFIKGNKVFTSPGEYVLKGITRQYIIDACRQLNLEVVEALTDVIELGALDGLFISGTSIKVLPVSLIDEKSFRSAENSVITAIRSRFDKIIDDYIQARKA
ncbi:MAG: aminotransferase class IV [Bacillota bacterium]|nr:aminotransferase class IV [Bacillota bacterium]